MLYKRDVRAAVAWAGLIWLSPIVGSILYAFFGINRIQRRASRLRTDESRLDEMLTAGAVRREVAPDAAGSESPGPYGLTALRSFVANVSNRSLTEGNEVTPLVNGDEGYPATEVDLHGDTPVGFTGAIPSRLGGERLNSRSSSRTGTAAFGEQPRDLVAAFQ